MKAFKLSTNRIEIRKFRHPKGDERKTSFLQGTYLAKYFKFQTSVGLNPIPRRYFEIRLVEREKYGPRKLSKRHQGDPTRYMVLVQHN